MNETEISVYRMNPAEDRIVFGEELEEGMLVLAEEPGARRPHGRSEDEQLRAQRFRRVTRLRREPGTPEKIIFVGEWVDGYQEVHRYAVSYGWIVKKEPRDDEHHGG
jgi:hypothetical protein